MPNQLVYTGTESVSAVMGTLRTTKEVFKRALEELTVDSIETVLDLIGQNALYRGEQFKNDLSVFLGHKRHYDSLPDADKLKRSINAALSRRAEANVVTRRYGLRQQVLYLMYYGEE